MTGLQAAVVDMLELMSKDGVCLWCGDHELEGYASPSDWWDVMSHHPSCMFRGVDEALCAELERSA